MKLPRNALVWCVLIVCLTLLIFTCLTRNRLCEVRLKDGTGRSRQAWLTNPTVSSNLEAGDTPPFQGCVGLTCLKRLYEGVAGSPVAPFSCLQEKPHDRRAKMTVIAASFKPVFRTSPQP
jgi:protein HokB